ncbi:MAG: hypothetical protein ACRDJE_01460, partial [Dehalococcoidia bacterium]
MKTTLNLPDDLMRAVKLRAVEENRRLTDMITDLLRRGLAQEPAASPAIPNRVRLPLVACAHEARTDAEMTPERVAEVLLEEEAGSLSRSENGQDWNAAEQAEGEHAERAAR